ncbi:Leucine-rich repeat-containing 2, lrrc2-like protein isoform 2 [Theobroma cacao]|uniref:Leucine-rich repeat-containing 2, lrrc2-like protein isoform 2 n=1 Tax=Theobroma cacao TaxID=3641 RepID=A0A061EJF4_THECC|nr:Leucine-rich repeat-containing 2, lrrc2-like protein isoform 2 [Theobroma cacao]
MSKYPHATKPTAQSDQSQDVKGVSFRLRSCSNVCLHQVAVTTRALTVFSFHSLTRSMEVVGAVVEVMLAKVILLATEQINVSLGFKEELTRLHDSLTIIQAALQDADRRQGKDRAVKLWLEKLRDVAYEADDVLDEFAYDFLRRKVEIQNQMMKKGG